MLNDAVTISGENEFAASRFTNLFQALFLRRRGACDALLTLLVVAERLACPKVFVHRTTLGEFHRFDGRLVAIGFNRQV